MHKNNRIMKRMYHDAWFHSKIYFFYAIFLVILNGVLPFANIYIPKVIIDLIINQESLIHIFGWVLFMTGANYIGANLKQVLLIRMNCIEDECSDLYRKRLGRTSMNMDYQYVESNQVLNQLEKATRGMFWYSGGIQRVTSSVTEIMSNIITLVGIIIMVIAMRQLYVIVIAVIVLAQILIEFLNSKADMSFFREMNKYNREFRYYTGILQNFSFGKEIRLFGAQELILSHVRDYQKYSDLVFKSKAKKKSFTGLLSNLVTMVLQVSMYANICHQIIVSKITIGSFSLLSSAYLNFVWKAGAISYHFFNIKKSLSLISDYYSFLDQYGTKKIEESEEKKPLPKEDYIVEFRNVSFCYPGTDIYVLKNINVTINSKQKVSIVGKNGAGKTTFIKLFIGLYEPTEGEIFINGRNRKQILLKQYQSMMATVFQDFKIYTASIKENVCMDAPFKSKLYEEALKKVDLREFVEHLPEKDETELSRQFSMEGQELSGGQKQRIAIARAMYRESPFLILDEPTAALDAKMEYEIYQLIHHWKKNGAVLFISHRLSSCTFCDRILVFDQGEIVQNGNHGKLYKEESGLYHELFHSQAKYYIDQDKEM